MGSQGLGSPPFASSVPLRNSAQPIPHPSPARAFPSGVDTVLLLQEAWRRAQGTCGVPDGAGTLLTSQETAAPALSVLWFQALQALAPKCSSVGLYIEQSVCFGSALRTRGVSFPLAFSVGMETPASRGAWLPMDPDSLP